MVEVVNGTFPPIYNPISNWNPNQLEIEFFWPLTEQIPLDLDYTGCATINHYVCSSLVSSGQTLTLSDGTGTTTWTSQLEINSDGLTFRNTEMPWYRKVLFKLMGFKWK